MNIKRPAPASKPSSTEPPAPGAPGGKTDPNQPHVRFEWDPAFSGGDYRGVGRFAYVPLAAVEKDGPEVAFRSVTGASAEHIVHYSMDELVDGHGREWEGPGLPSPSAAEAALVVDVAAVAGQTREQRLESALAGLVEWCRDNFVGEDGGPDLTEAEAALDLSEVLPPGAGAEPMDRDRMIEFIEAEGGILNEDVLQACAALGDTALSDEGVENIYRRKLRGRED